MSAGERIEIRRIAADILAQFRERKPGKRERKVIALAKELEVLCGSL